MTEWQNKAEESARFYIDLANDIYSKNLSYPRIRWNLRGTTAGKASLQKWEVHLHPELVESERQDYIDRTPAHEVAHLVAFKVYGIQRTRRGRVQAHGTAWKSVMRSFGLDPSRCHSYDVSKVRQTHKRTERKYVYACGCMEHRLTSIRHRRIETQGKYYLCTHCKERLKYVGVAA